jgi:hypothetical protein
MKSPCLISRLQHRTIVFAAFLMLTTVISAHATPVTVQNGSFENLLVPNTPGEIGSNNGGQIPQVTGWNTDGFNFVFTPSSADTIGAVGNQYGDLQLWGPGNGSNNGITASSPDGGNYIGLDGAFEQGALTQMVSGLTPGQKYAVSFWFAGAQQAGFDGINTEQFEVSLGNENAFTPILINSNHGFTGWQSQTLTFTASTSSELLSFLAIGTPNGVPPFSLLDGVSISAVGQTPEPSSPVLMLTGLAGVGSLMRARLKGRGI